MRSLLALVPFTLFAAASCGVAEYQTSPPQSNDDNGSGTDVGSAHGHVPACTPSCTRAADCGTPGDPLYDSSHFTCNAGACVWQGCRAASECKAEAHGGSFACQVAAGDTVPSCVPACRKASDCVAPGNTIAMGDASHFICNAGACQWTGCQSTAECAASLRTNKVACQQLDGAPTKTCVPTCATAADCASSQGGALTSASHYACKSGVCEWLGCQSTTECVQSLQSARVVCK